MKSTKNSSQISNYQKCEKYQAERIKRLRSDGINQFKLGTDRFKKFIDDPSATTTRTRPSLNGEVEVVIIGRRFGRRLTAASLYLQGIDNFRILGEGHDVGEPWYWNRFPDAQWDIDLIFICRC